MPLVDVVAERSPDGWERLQTRNVAQKTVFDRTTCEVGKRAADDTMFDSAVLNQQLGQT